MSFDVGIDLISCRKDFVFDSIWGKSTPQAQISGLFSRKSEQIEYLNRIWN